MGATHAFSIATLVEDTRLQVCPGLGLCWRPPAALKAGVGSSSNRPGPPRGPAEPCTGLSDSLIVAPADPHCYEGTLSLFLVCLHHKKFHFRGTSKWKKWATEMRMHSDPRT